MGSLVSKLQRALKNAGYFKGTVDGYTANRGKTAPMTVVEGPVRCEDGSLTLEVYIDRSLVEAFFNGDKAISIRSYAPPEAQGLQLAADGSARVRRLTVCALQSIYETE